MYSLQGQRGSSLGGLLTPLVGRGEGGLGEFRRNVKNNSPVCQQYTAIPKFPILEMCGMSRSGLDIGATPAMV